MLSPPPGFLLNLIYTIHRKGIVCSGIRNKNKKHGSNLIVSVTGLPALVYSVSSVWRSRSLALVSRWWMQKICHIWYLVLHAFSLIMPYMKYQLIPAKIRFLVHRIFFLLVGSFMERYFVFLVVHDEVSKQEGKGNIKQLFYVYFCFYLNQCRNIAESYTF